MWSPADIFFIIWHCNFAPVAEARLNVNDVIEAREYALVQKIVESKENEIIRSTIGLRNDLESR